MSLFTIVQSSMVPASPAWPRRGAGAALAVNHSCAFLSSFCNRRTSFASTFQDHLCAIQSARHTGFFEESAQRRASVSWG